MAFLMTLVVTWLYPCIFQAIAKGSTEVHNLIWKERSLNWPIIEQPKRIAFIKMKWPKCPWGKKLINTFPKDISAK